MKTVAAVGLRLSYTTPISSDKRHFSLTSRRPQATAAALAAELPKIEHSGEEDGFVYQGPLTKPFRNLKLFSLASIGLSASLSPLLFVVESSLPMSARFALAGIAVGTSGLSTSLISWCASPYVTTMHRFRPGRSGGAEELELTTQSLFLKPRVTRVFDPSFLIETRRPLARWELADKIRLTDCRKEAVGTNVHPQEGSEETVAETRDEKGEVIGRWIVKWGADGEGQCHQMGSVKRYFNVHEELLQ
ncbi:hypothetical protein CPB83DRAFT_764543 [Crepidotus variabilis]|uniref:Transmembrane protein n=1 Tax=Crepidotus variabilis TaxID=179855 RepID=A0A9P6EIJ6_9AGAR|nr:hypothetical protein CPB83DRAFT_764543 [Crepidotus variabilis]